MGLKVKDVFEPPEYIPFYKDCPIRLWFVKSEIYTPDGVPPEWHNVARFEGNLSGLHKGYPHSKIFYLDFPENTACICMEESL